MSYMWPHWICQNEKQEILSFTLYRHARSNNCMNIKNNMFVFYDTLAIIGKLK